MPPRLPSFQIRLRLACLVLVAQELKNHNATGHGARKGASLREVFFCELLEESGTWDVSLKDGGFATDALVCRFSLNLFCTTYGCITGH